MPELATLLATSQDPKQVSSITNVKTQLDDTLIVMRKTLDSVMERGEKVDVLMERSNDLSAQSKMFASKSCSSQYYLAGATRCECMWTDEIHRASPKAELVLRAHVIGGDLFGVGRSLISTSKLLSLFFLGYFRSTYARSHHHSLWPSLPTLGLLLRRLHKTACLCGIGCRGWMRAK